MEDKHNQPKELVHLLPLVLWTGLLKEKGGSGSGHFVE